MKTISVVFSWLLIGALSCGNVLAQTKMTSSEKQAEFKKRVVEWGTNKQVNVKLNSGEKISGRIAEIQNDFFAVQAVTKDGKVTSHQINFSDINKLSAKSSAGRTAGFTALGVLAAVGAVFVMLFAIYAASEG
jgi:hypothetical protein